MNNKCRKQIKRIFILIVLINIFLFSNLVKINAVESKEITSKINEIEDEFIEVNKKYITNLDNEKEVKDSIKNFILTVKTEGINKERIKEGLDIYKEVSDKYSNEEISKMIEDNKQLFEQYNIDPKIIKEATKVLKNIDTESLKTLVENVDIENIYNQLKNGASLKTILGEITKNINFIQKIKLVTGIIFSEKVVKTVITIFLVFFIYRTLMRCVIYKKAKKHAWAAFVPIYRNVTMLKICKMSPWWLLLLFVPIFGWIILFLVSVGSKFMLAEAFDKGTFFAIGLCILPVIFETILVFSKDIKYVGIEE